MEHTEIRLATTIVFTDASLASVVVKAVHITELRTAVNAARIAAGLGAFTFADNPLTGAIKRIHIVELRDALDAARMAMGAPGINYTDPSIIVGSTVVKEAHVTEIRAGVQ